MSKYTKAAFCALASMLFAGAAARAEDSQILIESYTSGNVVGVSNGNSVGSVEITVNGTGRDDIIGGHLSPVNGGTVGVQNYDSQSDSLIDRNFDAVLVTLNGGNIKQALRSNASNVDSVIYGNVTYNLNAGAIGIGSGYSADPMYLMGAGYYGQKGSSTNDVYGNVAINIGKAGGTVDDVFIGYNASNKANGFVVGSGTGTVRGDVSVNMQSGSAGYIFGASYGAIVKGDTHITVGKGAQINGYVLGGGSNINDAFSSDIAGSTNVLVQGTVQGNIYGGHYSGGTRGSIGNGVNVAVDGGSVGGNIYGGIGDITGNVEIVLNNASVSGAVYAGSESSRGGSISGDVNVTLSGNSNIGGNIYGGSAGGAKNLTVKSYTSSNALKVSDFDAINISGSVVAFGEPFQAALLSVSDDSRVTLSEGAKFDELTVLCSGEFGMGDELELALSDIFGDSSTIVENAVKSEESKFIVANASGEKFNAFLAENGHIGVGSAVPEPSACAAVFGALALAFAAYRRRR